MSILDYDTKTINEGTPFETVVVVKPKNYTITLSEDKKAINVVNNRTGELLESLVAHSYYFGSDDQSDTEQQIQRLEDLYNN